MHGVCDSSIGSLSVVHFSFLIRCLKGTMLELLVLYVSSIDSAVICFQPLQFLYLVSREAQLKFLEVGVLSFFTFTIVCTLEQPSLQAAFFFSFVLLPSIDFDFAGFVLFTTNFHPSHHNDYTALITHFGIPL